MTEPVTIGNATLWHGDCLDLRAGLPADAVISDPPYGMDYHADGNRFTRGGGVWDRILGDDEPFDPGPWLDYPRVVLFGSNHFAQRLPVGTTLVWLKRLKFCSFLSDAEIGWMKGGHGVHCHHDSSKNGPRMRHPAQKPVGLMAWCIDKAKVPDGGVILDPYMGSGTTGVAAVQAGYKFIGVEAVREYFDVACERIESAQAQGRLAL